MVLTHTICRRRNLRSPTWSQQWRHPGFGRPRNGWFPSAAPHCRVDPGRGSRFSCCLGTGSTAATSVLRRPTRRQRPRMVMVQKEGVHEIAPHRRGCTVCYWWSYFLVSSCLTRSSSRRPRWNFQRSLRSFLGARPQLMRPVRQQIRL